MINVIETVNEQWNNISQIEHSRHRSPFNLFVNLIAGLVAYTFREKKLPFISDSLKLFQPWWGDPYVELTLK